MKFIKNNKILIALLLIAVIMFSTIVIIIFSNLSSGNDEYGNRLDDIEKYPITDEVVNNIQNEISSLEKVKSVSYNLEGRIANFIIKVEDDLMINEAKNYAEKILEYFSEDLKNYYDIQILIDSDNTESENYPIIGYKHKTSDSLVWKQ